MNPQETATPTTTLTIIPAQPVQEVVPAAVEEAPKVEIAYTITDKYFPAFEVQKSANAWWMDREKVVALMQSFKNGYNIKEACIYAGISWDQYRYFVEKHPAFSQVKEACEAVCDMLAETANASLLQEKDGPQTRWYLERRKPDKYGRPGEGLVPNTVVNNFGTIISAPVDKIPSSVAERMKMAKQNG